MKPAIVSVAILGCTSVATGQVQIPDGFEIVQITNDLQQDSGGRINNSGEIVFYKQVDGTFEGNEIFLYDNGLTVQITDNDVTDWIPDINDNSMITWSKRLAQNDARIWLYENGTATELFPGRGPVINNLGHLVFKRYGAPSCLGPEMDVFFYDGINVVQITDAQGLAHQMARLNDNDQIAWTRFNFCPDPWESDIMLYSDGVITQLTDDSFEPQQTHSNNLGQVVWKTNGFPGTDFVEVWENGAIYTLTDWGSGPRLNNRGDISFNRWDEDLQTGYALVYHNDSGIVYQLTDGAAFTGGAQDINDWGEIVISMNFGFPHTDRSFLRRIRTGDSEFDGDVDADDSEAFENCFTGPGRVDGLGDCRFLDIDHDGDVDCDDWALFLKAWTGPPDEPPGFPACGCPADLDGNGIVGPFDLALLLGNWGPCPEPCTPGNPTQTCPADLDADCAVGPFDLAILLGNWGPCE